MLRLFWSSMLLYIAVAIPTYAQIVFPDASQQSTAGEPKFQRTYWVRGGGTDTNNGTALLDVMSEINALTQTETLRFAIHLEPGTYDLGATELSLLESVS